MMSLSPLILALIIGFNVSASKQIATLAGSKEVTLLTHNIIYKLLDMLKVSKQNLSNFSSPALMGEVLYRELLVHILLLT